MFSEPTKPSNRQGVCPRSRGTPLVAFQVLHRRDAEELRKEQWFTDELAALMSEGRPIWDGSGLVLRAGLEDEIKIYREGAQVRDSDEPVLV